MARYALAEHVFLCVSGEHVVLLDLKEDRYWALEAAQTAGLASLVRGWPVKGPEEVDEELSPSADTAAALEVLQSRGLLTDRIPPGKDATPVSAVIPTKELISEMETSAGARAGNWFVFLMSSAFAKFALRTWPFERVIGRVRRRKELAGRGELRTDVERARKLVEAFGRYRIFLFSSKDECLYDSFALIEFLARYDIYPDWVFGVQTRPFVAHCWVQRDEFVFNDSVERVSGYTPIMVV
jgi:Transglutaminase-like superfamily